MRKAKKINGYFVKADPLALFQEEQESLAWLTTGEPAKETGPSGEQTTPDKEGLHPNLVDMYARMRRKEQRMSEETLRAYAACSSDSTLCPSAQQPDQQHPPAP